VRQQKAVESAGLLSRVSLDMQFLGNNDFFIEANIFVAIVVNRDVGCKLLSLIIQIF